MPWQNWRVAMAEALYSEHGFYRRPEGPAGHFRTSVHASPFFAEAVAALARAAGCTTIVDVGAGRGELLRTLHALIPDVTLIGVEIAERPADLPTSIAWSPGLERYDRALLFANEWLDAVPLDIVELTEQGLRLVEVDTAAGGERLGAAPEAADAAWVQRWWPVSEQGARAEVGRARDEAWARAVAALSSGVAVAVDYGHELAGRPPGDTMVGYREGRVVPAVPDGTCDLTAHVAIDACAAAGEAAGAQATLLTRQRYALQALGLTGARPPLELASSDPAAYLQRLGGAGQEAELIDPAGLGRFYWLVQSVGMDIPQVLRP